MNDITDLLDVRSALVDLAEWITQKLREGHDPYAIDDYVTHAVDALLNGDTPPTRPF